MSDQQKSNNTPTGVVTHIKLSPGQQVLLSNEVARKLDP